ncbi:hypothetical protein [Mycobacterium sp.]|uniref:hypothetical protein n=1 Tax=Mycobacterium sp. TaxID=1785 RepID=UPI0025E29047|nr:hypothetical protein [Mycobacterium sp.]MBW0013497.1 hypothetical protein [Mycobacterium sp.]
MSVQDDKATEKDAEKDTEQDTEKDAAQDSGAGDGEEQRATNRSEKPEPDEEDKKKAAEMMTAYEDRPTLVLPGTGRMVTGTAVNDWLDDDGNPKFEIPDDASEDHKAQAKEARDDEDKKNQVEEDKALNEELRKAGAEENKGEESSSKR